MRERKLFGVRLFDLFIFLIVSTSLVLAGLIFQYFRTERKEERSVIYTVMLKDLPEDMISHIHIGDTAIDSVGKAKIGVVTSIYAHPAEREIVRDDGITVSAEYPGMLSVTLTIEGQGRRSSGGVVTGGSFFSSGDSIMIRMWDFAGEGLLTSVTI